MTNQEEIRGGLTKQEWVQRYLEDILGAAWRKGINKEGIDVTEEADKARLHLTKWGVVIKVEGELPKNPYIGMDDFAFIYQTAQQDMKDYTLTERLV